jgi:hypothetical protein
MRFSLLTARLVLILSAVAPTALAQSSAHGAAPAHNPVPSKKYCHPRAGFCFRYPNSWTMLGEVFDGNGMVIAPEQKDDRALWDEITVALVAPGTEDAQGPTLNEVMEKAATAMREAGQDFESLQRRELTVDHSPAQMLKARYRENAIGRDWIEELVFIQGQDDEIYSVALKCAPEHFSRLEPAWKQVLASWMAPEPQPPAAQAPDDKPSVPSSPSDSPKKQEEP